MRLNDEESRLTLAIDELERQRRRTLRESILNAIEKQTVENIARWGDQEGQTMVVALAEETGEVARAVLSYDYRPAEFDELEAFELTVRIEREAIQTAAVCVELARVAADEGERLKAEVERQKAEAERVAE